MTIALIACGLVLLSFPGWLDNRHRFGPAQFARVSRASMTLGVAGVMFGFSAWGAPAVLHWADAVGIPGLCDAAIHKLPFGGLELAMPMSVAAIVLIGRASTVARRARLSARRARVDPYFGRHRSMGQFDVVVVPSAQLVAVGIPGEAPQIVLSEGLVAELSTMELDAVIRHEVAHHRLRHRQYLLIASVVDQLFGWIRPVRASVVSLRNAVEEWADLASTQSVEVRIEPLRSALQHLATRRTTTDDRHSIHRRIASLDGTRCANRRGRSLSVGAWVPTIALGALGTVALVFAVQITGSVIRCSV